MKFIRHATSLFAIIALFSFTALPAYAAGQYDSALYISISPDASTIANGSSVDIEFSIVNEGSDSFAPVGLMYIFLPPELSYTGVSSPHPAFHCPGVMHMPETGLDYDPKYDDHTFIACYNEDAVSLFPVAAPGATTSVTIHATATGTLQEGVTQIVAVNSDREEETNFVNLNLIMDIQSMSESDPAGISSNNVASYVYEVPSATTTTTLPGPQTTPSTDNTSSVASNTNTTRTNDVSNDNSTDGTLEGTSLIEEKKSEKDSSKKAEVALDLRSSLPDRISRDDTSAWEAIFTQRYRNQFIGLGMILAFALGTYFVLRKRYLKKVTTDKEYRKALRAKTINPYDVSLLSDPEKVPSKN